MWQTNIRLVFIACEITAGALARRQPFDINNTMIIRWGRPNAPWKDLRDLTGVIVGDLTGVIVVNGRIPVSQFEFTLN